MFKHITVLLHETVDALSIKPDGIYVDCTLGGAGHSQYLLSQLTTGHLYCFDQDMQAIDHAKNRLAKEIDMEKRSFRNKSLVILSVSAHNTALKQQVN